MNIGELISKIIDMPQGIETNIEGLDYDGKSVTFKLGKSQHTQVKKKSTRDDKINRVRSKIEQGDFNFNFHEFAYCLEILVRDKLKTPYVANVMRDTQQIKKVFPNNKAFGKEEYDIIETYVDIFNAVIKTPSYVTPTWGGLVYAMPKVKKAMKPQVENKGMELTGEVF